MAELFYWSNMRCHEAPHISGRPWRNFPNGMSSNFAHPSFLKRNCLVGRMPIGGMVTQNLCHHIGVLSSQKLVMMVVINSQDGAVVTRVRPLSSERAVPVPCKINDVKTSTRKKKSVQLALQRTAFVPIAITLRLAFCIGVLRGILQVIG